MAKSTNERLKGRKIKQKKDRLPLFIALGGVVVIILALFFAFQKKADPYIPEVTGGPSLKADKERVNLGDVKLGTPVQVSFELKNVGDQPLKFLKKPTVEVKEGC